MRDDGKADLEEAIKIILSQKETSQESKAVQIETAKAIDEFMRLSNETIGEDIAQFFGPGVDCKIQALFAFLLMRVFDLTRALRNARVLKVEVGMPDSDRNSETLN